MPLDDFIKDVMPTDPTIIDVRRPERYINEGHIAGAVNIPRVEIGDYSPTGKVYIICHSGVDSKKASRNLTARGFDCVNVEGGMITWTGDRVFGKDPE